MATYQNSAVTASKLIIGNFKIETGATALSSMVNLGAGMISAWGHNLTKYDVQAGNAPDPIEGVAEETFTIAGELIEYDASVLSAISGGLLTSSSTTAQSVLSGGGLSVQTPRAFKLTNTTILSGATKQTIINVFYATMDTSVQFTAKSDNDADPIGVMAFTITGKPDTSRTAGSNMFTIIKDL